MRPLRISLYALTLLLLSGCAKAATNSGNDVLSKLPSLTPVVSNELSCESIVSAGMWKDPDHADSVTTSIKKGTDKLAVKFDDESLSLITTAAVEAGMADAAPFKVVENTDSYVTAVYYAQAAFPSINTFSLNKKTGLAVWTKARPDFVTTDAPTGDSIYLHCQ